jgi:hypothetical protein
MKTKLFVAFALCSLLLVMYAETVAASNPAYPTTIYSLRYTPGINGYWDNNTEWSDAVAPSGLPANLTFRNKWSVTFTGGVLKVYEWYLIEFLGDNTNDTGDYVQICYDSNATSSAAPKAIQGNATTPDLRIDFVGHAGNASIKTYVGTGTGWALGTVNDTLMAQTLNTSRLNSNPHWITEFRIEKQANGLGMNNGIRIAVYDASKPSAGVIAYPPTSSQDVPNSYSLNSFTSTNNFPTLTATARNSVTVLPGWTWWFFVQSTGGVQPITYQWYDASGPIAGQTSMLLPVTKNAPGNYTLFCRVSDSEGQIVNTANITMTVLG